MSSGGHRLRRLRIASNGDPHSGNGANMTTDIFQDTHLAGSISSKHPRTARRIGSVLAGLVTIFFLSTATDMALHATSVFPPFGERMSDALFVLAAAYRVLY